MGRTKLVPDVEATPVPERLFSVRALTLRLSESLTPEDCQAQSMTEASPVKWHLAHTTWFFETFVLKPYLTGYAHFDPQFEYLFNSYYNGIGEQYPRSKRGLMTRPSLDHVIAYRAHVDAALRELLEAPVEQAVIDLLELGVNHEQQHQELILTDVKHALYFDPQRPAYRPCAPTGFSKSRELRWLRHEGGIAAVGHGDSSFAFDNEGPRHEVMVQAFELASRSVTNDEFRAFIEDGGYSKPQWWLSDGWDWVKAQAVTEPLYWAADLKTCFTLSGERKIVGNEPVVHISYYEADAFARWAGARLPREAEWEVIAATVPVSGNFLDLNRLHPTAALDTNPPTPQQLFGDVWEWTQSAYCAYPGFRTAEGVISEYNGKFMCNQMVLRGGSCATPPGHVRATYRNFFPPSARWQFSGIRLARDV